MGERLPQALWLTCFHRLCDRENRTARAQFPMNSSTMTGYPRLLLWLLRTRLRSRSSACCCTLVPASVTSPNASRHCKRGRPGASPAGKNGLAAFGGECLRDEEGMNNIKSGMRAHVGHAGIRAHVLFQARDNDFVMPWDGTWRITTDGTAMQSGQLCPAQMLATYIVALHALLQTRAGGGSCRSP
jgi:hypothetical protein